jgi:hypothetical protein
MMNAATTTSGFAATGIVPSHSRHGFYCAMAFVMWTVVMRFVLPFGDEPDFTVRAVELVERDGFPPWVPYHWLGSLLSELQVESNCKPDASPTSIWGHIDSSSCLEPLEQIVIRSSVTLLCCVPLLWALVYRRALFQMLRAVRVRLDAEELNERLDALGTALLIPGMVYYLGLMSHEQFSLVISLLISVVWGNWWLVLSLAAYTVALDLGNGAIVAAFLILYLIITLVWRSFGFKGLIIFLFGAGAFTWIGGYEILNYAQIVPLLLNKAEAIYAKSLTADFLEKYPTILRPFITYITATFMTPAGVKALPIQLMFAMAMLVCLHRFRMRLSLAATASLQEVQRSSVTDDARLLPMIAALTTILAFSLMLPDYANAKYYMFLAPFFVRPFVVVFSRRSRLLFMNACGTVMLIMLAFQYA